MSRAHSLVDEKSREIIPRTDSSRRATRSRLSLTNFLLLALLCTLLLHHNFGLHIKWLKAANPPPEVDHYESIQNYCSAVPPISTHEIIQRQNKLASLLKDSNAIYVAEPGPSALYFGNISSSNWYLSERPLLLIVSPNAQITILTPKFEATRAKQLTIPSNTEVSYVEWAEDENPYEAAIGGLSALPKTVYVDDQMRMFVAEGLRNAAPDTTVQVAPKSIKSLREKKSDAEIALLRCANEATLLAIRIVRKHIKIGMQAAPIRRMLGKALQSAGLQSADSAGIVLFGADAALPHGGATDRVLTKSDLVLIDVGGTLHGYHSDITRTFALEKSEITTVDLVAWYTVQLAQRSAHNVAKNGTIASAVDHAARDILTKERYGEYFTHRLGHGIGLETHETPYLRGGSEDILEVGNTFSNEPGVYIPGKVGCRLEDIFVVSEDGSAEFLTSRVGGPAQSPWLP